jgi:hypothetical protein
MVHQWIYAAQTWLSGPLEKDRLNISGIQIYCLTILARQIFSVGSELVWVSVGSLIHRAMQIGLHRDPKHLPAMSLLEAELRRRIWASILEFCIQSSLDSAMPPRISLDEFDTEAPSNINDDEIDESTKTLQPKNKGSYTSTSMQLLLLDSMPTRLRILQVLNSLHAELSYEEVILLDSKMTHVSRACNNFTKKNTGAGITSFHRNMLDHLVRRCLLPLHCPFASKARSNPCFYYSRKVSLDTAMALISPEPDEIFSRLMVIGGGFIKENIVFAASVINLELLALVEDQRLDGTLYRNPQSREILKQTVRDILSLSAERVRHGETSTKLHMFLSMVMAQVEAVEAGTQCEDRIAQSARDSLEICQELLQPQAENLSMFSPGGTRSTSTDPVSGVGSYGLEMDHDFDFDFDFFFSAGSFT